MPTLAQRFAAAFTFSRPITGRYRDAGGEEVEAAINVPRLDHDADGTLIGLLVEPGAALGQADKVRTVPGDWEKVGATTILHEMMEADGTIVRRAYYSRTMRATLDGVLATAGHHRVIAAVPGHLKNRGGNVRYREKLWYLPGAIADGEGAFIADSVDRARPLIEG